MLPQTYLTFKWLYFGIAWLLQWVFCVHGLLLVWFPDYRYIECMLARKPSECTSAVANADERNELKYVRIWSQIITCCAVGGAILLYYIGEINLVFQSLLQMSHIIMLWFQSSPISHWRLAKFCLPSLPSCTLRHSLQSNTYKSNRFTLFAFPDRPVQSETNSASSGSILAALKLHAKTKSLTFPALSIARYSFIQLSQLGRQSLNGGNENGHLRNGNKGGFEPRLTWLRVRHSTTELPCPTEAANILK